MIEGQDGTDTMLFNGAAGRRHRHDVGERRAAHVLPPTRATSRWTPTKSRSSTSTPSAAADSVTVNDLTGTDVTQTNLDLASALGGTAADGAVDNVVVNGTNGDDTIDIDGNGSGADVTGLATAVSVKHADPTPDRLSVHTLAGTDNVTANGVAGLLQVLVDGAAVSDTSELAGPGSRSRGPPSVLGGDDSARFEGRARRTSSGRYARAR